MHLQVGDAAPDQAVGLHCGDLPVQRDVADMHRRLCDPVHVDQHRGVVRVPRVPVLQAPELQGFAAEDHAAQRQSRAQVRLLQVGLHQLVEGRRRLVQDRDLLAHEQRQELRGRAAEQIGDDDQAAAAKQGPPQLPDREVEGMGMEHGPDVVRAEAIPVLGGAQQAHDVLLGDDHALGPSGGARGVDDVGGVERGEGPGADAVGGVGSRARGDRLAHVGRVQQQGGHARWQQLCGGRVADHADGRGILEHEGQAVPGIVHVQRQVGGAGLDDGQQADHQLQGTRQRQGHEALGAHALCDQVVCELVGTCVELAISQRGVLEDKRDGVRCLCHLRFEERRQRGLGNRCDGVVPSDKDLLALLGREDLDVADGLRNIGSNRLQHALQALHDLLDNRALEQIGPVTHAQLQLRSGNDRDAQRIVRGVSSAAPGTRYLHAGIRRLACMGIDRIVLEDEQRVKERCEAAQALDVRQAQVLVRDERGLLVLQPCEDLGDGLVGLELQAQRQGVDEQAHHGLHAGQLGRATGDRDAEDHVLAARQACKQRTPSALHEGVERQAVLAGLPGEGLGQRPAAGSRREHLLAARGGGRQRRRAVVGSCSPANASRHA
jgi:hypothetical protein